MHATEQTSTSPKHTHRAAASLPPSPLGLARGLAPGIALTIAMAATAFALRTIPALSLLSPMLMAMGLGMAFNAAAGSPVLLRPGLVFVLRRLLRLGIVLLGLQLTAGQLLDVGGTGLAIILGTLAASFVFTTWLGRALGLERGLTELIAAGTAICGASAIIATNTVTRARSEDAAYAVACVTVFGSLAMFLYPFLGAALHLEAESYGLWAGASIHEVAQVLAAAFQRGQEAGELGTIAKLARVIVLAPLIMLLAFLTRRRQRGETDDIQAHVPAPWFVLGFVGLVMLNSVVAIPGETKAMLGSLATFLLTMAMGAMGLQTDVRQLRARGVRPMLLGLGATVFIAMLSLTLVLLFV